MTEENGERTEWVKECGMNVSAVRKFVRMLQSDSLIIGDCKCELN